MRTFHELSLLSPVARHAEGVHGLHGRREHISELDSISEKLQVQHSQKEVGPISVVQTIS